MPTQKGIIGFGFTSQADSKSKSKNTKSEISLNPKKPKPFKPKTRPKRSNDRKSSIRSKRTRDPVDDKSTRSNVRHKSNSQSGSGSRVPPRGSTSRVVQSRPPRRKRTKPEGSKPKADPAPKIEEIDDDQFIREMAEKARLERASRKKPTHTERKRARGRKRMERIKKGVKPSGPGFELGTEDQDFDSLRYLAKMEESSDSESDSVISNESKHSVKLNKVSFSKLRDQLLTKEPVAVVDSSKDIDPSAKPKTNDVWKMPDRPSNDVLPSYSDYSASSDDDIEDTIDTEEVKLTFVVDEPQKDHNTGLITLGDSTFYGKSVMGSIKYPNLGFEIASHILSRKDWIGTVITPDEQLSSDIQVFAFLSIINPYSNANLPFISHFFSSWASSASLDFSKKFLTLPDISNIEMPQELSDTVRTSTITLKYDKSSKTKILTPFPHITDPASGMIIGLALWNQIINLPTELSIKLWEKTEKELIWARKDGFVEYSFNLICIPTFILKSTKGAKSSSNSEPNTNDDTDWVPFDNSRQLYDSSSSNDSDMVRLLPNVAPVFENSVPSGWVFLTPAAEEFYIQSAVCDMITPKTIGGNLQYPVSTLFSQNGSKSHHLKMLLMFISPKNISSVITKLKQG